MYYLLVMSVLLASFNSIILKESGAIKKETVFKFNFLSSLVWCVLLFFSNTCTLHINSQVIFWGVLYGVAQTGFLWFKTAAMGTGSVSVTTLIGNSSLLISLFVSLILWKESVTSNDIAGLILLGISIFLCTYRKSDKQYTPGWKYYVVFFLLFAASVGIIFKGFGKSGNIEYCGDMMLFSAIIMLFGNFVVTLITKEGSLVISDKKRKRNFLLSAVGSGFLSCLYNRLNIFLAGSIDAIIFFPGFNGGVVLLSTFLSVILLKEKLLILQKIGLFIGAISICVIGIL